MLRSLVIFLLSYFLTISSYADLCDLADEINFPNTSCSFTSMAINVQELRFGKVDEIESGTNEGEFILRSGASVLLMNSNTDVFDEDITEDEFGDEVAECQLINNLDEKYENLNESLEIAYILEDNGLNAPRTINKIWILGCELNQPR